MLIKTRGIIFRAMKYRESSLILDIYTEERGLRKYLISGVRSSKARTQAGLLQVTSLVDLVAYEREDRDLNRIKEVRPAHVYQSTPFEVRKGAIGLFMAEVARKTIREREANGDLFNFLFTTFQFLDLTTDPIGNIHLHFLVQLSAYLGFMPAGDLTPTTPFFDLREGMFIEALPGHTYFLDEHKSRQLAELLEVNRAQAHTVSLTRADRQALLNDLLLYYRLHIEGMAEIQAHDVLRVVLG